MAQTSFHTFEAPISCLTVVHSVGSSFIVGFGTHALPSLQKLMVLYCRRTGQIAIGDVTLISCVLYIALFFVVNSIFPFCCPIVKFNLVWITICTVL